ncbi:MAG: hypothetical protein HRU20_21830, partial [Pseudomonadales bacterium]|nr:hypothetical protein [Pseudomonadales bacterium]
DLSKRFTYKGMRLNDIPNLAFSLGYSNASWTLKSDLTAQYVCRLLNHMDKSGKTICCAKTHSQKLRAEMILNFTSGYVLRSIASFPKQGNKSPWKVYQNYLLDKLMLSFASLEDPSMEFSSRFEAEDKEG